MNHGIKDFRFRQILMEIDIEKDYLTFNLIMNAKSYVENVFVGF